MTEKQIEIRWLIFLLAILIISFGLLTRFAGDRSLDIQMYDTYYLIDHFHLFLFLLGALSAVYLLTYGLKILAKTYNTLKIFIMTFLGLLGIGLAGHLAVSLRKVIRTEHAESYGILPLIFGFAMLFLIRTKEIGNIK
ncbi:hypothetical protein SAMN04488104_10371 [Algoriphagus faecimaris]|uniref:Cytochrome C and Quinol oxidase polypeptide I n=1 Tax=Algoriphagus faecimaris TaxID=686796 RepID=A0A1G6VNI8_9BACT|nr:hypothetical protein [Algoriphagus faecimaris]SDD55119.1 hypothetical protein SAMN04488104_10371 [Algoriphagus faecimaris]